MPKNGVLLQGNFIIKLYRSELFWVGVVVVLFSCYLLFACRFDINIYDEAIPLYGASRILNGEVIYRDFWTLYAPGQFYILAGIFKIFGQSIMAGRLFTIGVQILLVLCVYFLTKKLGGRWCGVFSMFLVSLWTGGLQLHSTAMYPSLLLSLSSCLCVINYIDCRRWKWLISGGVLTGATMLFRQDTGLYTFLAESVVILFFSYRKTAAKGVFGWKRLLEPFLVYAYFISSVVISVLPAGIFLLTKAGVKDSVYDSIIFPGVIYSKFRDIPFPSLSLPIGELFSGELPAGTFFRTAMNKFLFYLPVVLPLTAAQLFVSVLRREKFSSEQWGLLLVLLLGICLLNYARCRTDIPHMVTTNIVSVIVLTVGLFRFRGKLWQRWYFVLRAPVFILAVITISVVVWIFTIDCRAKYTATFQLKEEGSNMAIARARGILARRDVAEVEEKAVKYIQQHVPKDEKIFVCNLRHDIIHHNDIMFYFLSERTSATKYHELHAGVATTLPVQKQIIEELKRNAVNYIVILALPNLISTEANRSSESSGVLALDNFLRTNYTIVKRFSPYLIAKKTALRED